VDRVHAWLVHRHEEMRTPFRDLAKEIGLPKSTVQKFYQQKSKPGKIWPKLRNWYVENRAMKTQRKEAYRTHPHTIIMSAMMTLVHVPLSERPASMREMAEAMKKIHEARGLPCPEWVTQFAEAADAAQHDSRIAEIDYWIPEYPRTSLS
jgi:DNA-binding Lrp family transcriptional regulator